MRMRILLVIGLVLLGSAANVRSQEVIWRSAKPVTLGTPSPLPESSAVQPRVVRGQIPPPPAFPGSTAPPVYPAPGGPAGVDMYNKGVVNNDSDLGGFWTRTGDRLKRCWDEVTGGASSAFQGQHMFQSDTRFQGFASPVTNPFFAQDPRALTEIRPLLIWQHTPSANPVWNGGNNFQFAATGSVAITPHISLTLNRLGFSTINPRVGSADVPAGSATGFSDIALGPKISFGSEASNSVFAFGLIFDIPAGSNDVLQGTGRVMLDPYFSYAQNFGRSEYGSFNFMNTTGYTFRTDSTRTEAFYSSFHLDFDWGNAKRFYPLVELNWRHYTRNGSARTLNFEGSDLANFGSNAVAGRDELTLAVGTRVRLNNFAWWGIAAEFNVLKNGDGRHLDQFRLTTDFIFRY